jgi:hypothetical protein
VFLLRTYVSSGELRKTIAQLGFFVTACIGIGQIYEPAALIFGGLALVAILEVRQ